MGCFWKHTWCGDSVHSVRDVLHVSKYSSDIGYALDAKKCQVPHAEECRAGATNSNNTHLWNFDEGARNRDASTATCTKPRCSRLEEVERPFAHGRPGR